MANVKDLLVNGSARVIGTIYGNATSANKLNTNAGSASQPVYFNNGVPVAITGTISNNAATATKATQDSAGQQINTTYIKGLSVSGKTITYTKGDGTTGTITTQDNNTTYSAGTGLSLSGTTFNHKNSVTAGTAQGDASKTLTFGGTFTIPTITYDAQGHITGKGTTTMTMPANPNTDTHWTTGITAGETGTTSNSATTNGNTFIKIKDNSTHRGQIKLVGSGATSVSSDANGVITISSTDNNTTYGSMSLSEGTTGTATSNRVLTAANLKGIINAHAPTKTGGGASGSWGISITGNAASASKVNNKLTVGSKTYDGSAAVSIAASDLGLASAMLFLGTTTTAITDGAKINPVVIGGSNKTVTAGNVVLYGSKEFVWTGSAWEELGNEGSYKVVQSAVGDPSASGTSNTFIATISQDTNGKITATKKTVAVTNSAPTLAWGTTSTIGIVAGTNLQVKMPANPNVDTKVTQNAITASDYTNWRPIIWGSSNNSTEGFTPSTVTDGVYTAQTLSCQPSSGTIRATTFKGNLSGNASTATKATKDSADQQINTTYIKGLSISGRTITYTKGDGTTGTITTQDTNTTYGVATSSANGLMSSSDKSKLDGIAAGANKYSHPTSSGNKHIPAGGSSGQILRWSADGTAVWGADTNTWRGIQNNLTSDSTTDSLAAAQGKALKVLIDGKAASSHTHNYAGSSSAGGAANSANKLATARTITLSGAVTGSASFDGSKNITITTTGSQQTLPYSSSTSQLFITTTANQANYTLSNFIDNAIYHVYVNGFKIPSSEYTVSSSGVVTLSNPPELANQEVEIVANYTSYVTTDSSVYNSSYLNYYRQATAPSNTNALWLDTSTTTSSSSFTPKLYDGGKWNAIGGADTATLDARYVLKSGDTTLDTRYVKKTGDTMSGDLIAHSIVSNNWLKVNAWPNYGTGWGGFWYNGDNETLVLQIDSGYNGNFQAGKVYGAVWNDYAEYRKSDITEPGRVVIENGDGTLSLSTKRLQRGAEVISDTYGFAIGETDECKTPIAATGRVLAYTYEPVEEYKSKIGWPVCSGPNGTVSIMTKEEEEKYPSRIIGIISEVPDYEEWGTGKVKTNGRVWIRIK